MISRASRVQRHVLEPGWDYRTVLRRQLTGCDIYDRRILLRHVIERRIMPARGHAVLLPQTLSIHAGVVRRAKEYRSLLGLPLLLRLRRLLSYEGPKVILDVIIALLPD